jgi:hypothetical protein
LIIDVNPFMTGKDFHPDAVYRITIIVDGDAVHRCRVFVCVFAAARRPANRDRLLRNGQPGPAA